jgi:hypothetical protein
MLLTVARNETDEWLRDRRNRRVFPHRLEKCGYAPVRNPDASDGIWKIEGQRQVVYAKKSMPLRNQVLTARSLKSGPLRGTSGAIDDDQGMLELDKRCGGG